MRIQLIGKGWGKCANFEGVAQSPLASPRSLDEFDVNIIDLATPGLWENDEKHYGEVNDSNDLRSIRQMVINSKKAQIVYVLPMNHYFRFYKGTKEYYRGLYIKDDLPSITKGILAQVLPKPLREDILFYENTRTIIQGKEYEADLYFRDGIEAVTVSNLSEKTTTIELSKGILATTLNITSSKEQLLNFVDYFFCDEDESDRPEWFDTINFYDDGLQKEIINQREAEIERAKQAIKNANDKLRENDRYKSVLYANGATLVQVVFEILEQLLDCDLSEFEDKKNEDFLIRLPDCTLIGEIKGVTSNIKSEHIGQIEHHYQRYMDELEEKGITEKVQQILIINPFRTKAPDAREPVNDKQISLAKRNGCLIVETQTLLKIFEKYLENRIASAQCIDVFCNKTGLLQITDIPTEQHGEIEAFKI